MVFHRRAVDARAVRLELLLRGEQRRLGAVGRVPRMLPLLCRNGARARQALAACEVFLGLGKIRLTHGDRGLQLPGCREQAAYLAHSLRELRIGLVERDLGIGLVEPHQRLSGIDELRVVGADRDNGPGDLRGDLHDVAADVGVIGRLDIAQRRHPIGAVGNAHHGERADHDREPADAAFLHADGRG